MNRRFSLEKLLKLTPNSLLREFFECRECPMLCVGWDTLNAHQFQPLLAAFRWNTPEKQAEILAILQIVFELASAEGARRILAAAERRSVAEFPHKFPSGNGYHQALWTWLNYPDVFAEALVGDDAEPAMPPRIDRREALGFGPGFETDRPTR